MSSFFSKALKKTSIRGKGSGRDSPLTKSHSATPCSSLDNSPSPEPIPDTTSRAAITSQMNDVDINDQEASPSSPVIKIQQHTPVPNDKYCSKCRPPPLNLQHQALRKDSLGIPNSISLDSISTNGQLHFANILSVDSVDGVLIAWNAVFPCNFLSWHFVCFYFI